MVNTIGITYLHKTIGQLRVTVKCKQTGKFRNTTKLNLQSKLYILKQNVKAKREKS